MSALKDMLTAWDEAALIGLASKGVVVRAGKDAAKVETLSIADDRAELKVLAETVTLIAPDPRTARCTCPATGPCRHIIAAILSLRDGAAPAPVAIGPDIGALSFDDIQAFARADWPAALALADSPAEASGDGTRNVTFPETGDSVTFAAGQPLASAIHKGRAAGRARRAIAAAALVLAREAGRDLPEAVVAEVTRPRVDPTTLDRAQAVLETAAQSLAAGTLQQAADRLFTLAISTRAEAVPRLAAELRGLSKRFDEDRLRRADDTPEGLFLALGRTYALTRALRLAPDDPALMGVLARSFAPSGHRDLVFLGGEHWTTPSGARGLTLAFVDETSGTIHRATEARSAGTDLTFSGRQAWYRPLWHAGKPSQLGGKRLHLADAKIAPDGGLGLSQMAQAKGAVAAPTDHAVTDWSALPNAIDAQLGIGLRRRPGEALLLVAPDRVIPPDFDAYDQVWNWPFLDDGGGALPLRLPDNMITSPERLETMRPKLALAAFRPSGAGRLISVWLAGEAAPRSLLFDGLPVPTGFAKTVAKLRNRLPRRSMTAPPPDPVRLLMDRAAETALQGLARPTPSEALAGDAQALGLARIAEGLAALDGGARPALELAWRLALAQEVA